jgi:DNA polymerase-3 subunit gamma/tau
VTHRVISLRYRPQDFDELTGQSHITRSLKGAVKSGRIGHAFLFAGPRGVGKTTTARILAKSLNCNEGANIHPCQKCQSCKEITLSRNLDVIEIDGASNRGIDEIRNLREGVRYSPIHGRYKIYIIDEVHMLTQEAFNALLKTLEEPPPKVIFIFATTNPMKIPTTILSRCQRFVFKRLSIKEISSRLGAIA